MRSAKIFPLIKKSFIRSGNLTADRARYLLVNCHHGKVDPLGILLPVRKKVRTESLRRENTRTENKRKENVRTASMLLESTNIRKCSWL